MRCQRSTCLFSKTLINECTHPDWKPASRARDFDSTQSVFRTLVTIKSSFEDTFMEFEKRSSNEIGIEMQKKRMTTVGENEMEKNEYRSKWRRDGQLKPVASSGHQGKLFILVLELYFLMHEINAGEIESQKGNWKVFSLFICFFSPYECKFRKMLGVRIFNYKNKSAKKLLTRLKMRPWVRDWKV